MEKTIKKSEKNLGDFISIANEVLDMGGQVGFEWPRYCEGWWLQILQKWIKDRNLSIAEACLNLNIEIVVISEKSASFH